VPATSFGSRSIRIGPALTGIEIVRPETTKIYSAPIDEEKLPFDPRKFSEHDLPWTHSDK
jgi:hypothetical protein